MPEPSWRPAVRYIDFACASPNGTGTGRIGAYQQAHSAVVDAPRHWLMRRSQRAGGQAYSSKKAATAPHLSKKGAAGARDDSSLRGSSVPVNGDDERAIHWLWVWNLVSVYILLFKYSNSTSAIFSRSSVSSIFLISAIL